MDETILFPSPNWFQVSGLAVSTDGWLFYGGASKSLCVLRPLPDDYKGVVDTSQRYQAHVINRAHSEKIVSVSITPAWPTTRCILTGSADGSVKQWAIQEKQKVLDIKPTHTHNIHTMEKEEVAGIGYSTDICAITVGSFGNIVKWDLNSNVVKTYSILKKFKPSCVACSPHTPLIVAVGTRQGVVIVLDLNGDGKILYKVRGHDDDIMNIGWCPQYEISIKKSLIESEKKNSVSDRLNRIRASTTDSMCSDISDLCKIEVESDNSKIENNSEAKPITLKKGDLQNQSGTAKDLPNDSFEDMEIITQDDMFDIYKDHESDEFGHKKYQPEEIIVKVKEDKKDTNDFLAECNKLKEQILKNKNASEASIEELVDALDKTHVDNERVAHAHQSDSSSQLDNNIDESVNSMAEYSVHVHRHLLASIGKQGSVRIWSKSGKLVGACSVPNNSSNNRNSRKKDVKTPQWTTLLWYKPDVLLIADGKSQLLKCNPLQIDCKNKLSWSLVHNLHSRGLFCIASNAPRIQSCEQSTEAQWHVWTASQDRSLNCYSMTENKLIATHMTCGGFLYNIQSCPYDASRLAISVGDGAVRVWEADTLIEDDTKLNPGHVDVYWQNVQGKVLSVAWHPEKEHCLAFATAESRVGLLQASGKAERAARLLSPAGGSAYSLSWGAGDRLYAAAAGRLMMYNTNTMDNDPEELQIEVQGQKWAVTAVRWHPRALVCGNIGGAVALLTPAEPHTVRAVAFPFTKTLYTMDWHPQETSMSDEESPNKNLIAVCSFDKKGDIVILEYKQNEDGSEALEIQKSLSGHRGSVLQVAWNPHVEAQLLSTSHDSTVRIWDVLQGVCTAIFSGHAQSSLGAAWSPMPQFATKVFSGGADCCLRLWDVNDHPVDAYNETHREIATKKKKSNRKKEEKKPVEPRAESPSSDVERIAATLETKQKPSKKFLLPIMHKQIIVGNVQAVRKLLEKMNPDAVDTKVKTETSSDVSEDYDIDYIKLFGSASEVNEYLDMEMSRLTELGLSEPWSVLCVLRGDMDALVRRASARDALDPFLLALAPAVSAKYWKDAIHMYLAQIDRLVAKEEEDRLCENKMYGGPVYRKVATLLSIHDVVGGLNTLVEARLYKEAYALCRIRYLDSFTDTILHQWARDSCNTGLWVMAAVCYIVLGNLSQAATVLGKSNNEECLSMAAELAKLTGQTALAKHMEKKAQDRKQAASDSKSEDSQLPSKAEVLLKGIVKDNETEAVALEEDNSDRNETSYTSSSIAPETDENSQHAQSMDNESTPDESDENPEEGAAALRLVVKGCTLVNQNEVTKDKPGLSQLEDAINENYF